MAFSRWCRSATPDPGRQPATVGQGFDPHPDPATNRPVKGGAAPRGQRHPAAGGRGGGGPATSAARPFRLGGDVARDGPDATQVVVRQRMAAGR
jgi:hypothetical protein